MRKTLTAKDIEFETTVKIHIRENFTLSQHKLIMKAKNELQKTGMYRYVWTQNGTVLGEQIEKIRCDCNTDIVRLSAQTRS